MYIAVAQQRLYEVAVAAVWGPLYDDTSHSMYQPPPPPHMARAGSLCRIRLLRRYIVHSGPDTPAGVLHFRSQFEFQNSKFRDLPLEEPG
jgi:hypothetical protein